LEKDPHETIVSGNSFVLWASFEFVCNEPLNAGNVLQDLLTEGHINSFVVCNPNQKEKFLSGLIFDLMYKTNLSYLQTLQLIDRYFSPGRFHLFQKPRTIRQGL